MPAAVETKDGKALFVAGRNQPGWHGLGTVVDGTMTLSEVLELAGLRGWNVRLVPFDFAVNGDKYELPGQFVVVRDNPFTGEPEALAVVGSNYKVIQVEEAFAWTEALTNVGGQWDTAGSLNGGRQVFGSMLLSREFTLDPAGANDAVQLYLGCATSFDGSLQNTVYVDPMRVVCKNTLTVALKSKRIYKVRHTKNAEGKMEDARAALRVGHTVFDEWEAAATALYETEATRRDFEAIVDRLYPVTEPEVRTDGSVKNAAAITRRDNLRETLSGIYFTAGTNDNIRGTAWGVFNALTEYVDWYRPTKGDNKKANLLTAQLGMEGSDKEKARILSAVKELTGANF